MTAREPGRILTDNQAASVAKQARKYDKSLPHSAKGVTVRNGKVEVTGRKVKIVAEES
jgi:hypothetical protein